MSRLRVTLLGGVNEIGGNKFLLEDGDARLMLDFGTSIGARNLFFEEYLQPRTNAVLRDLFRLGLLPDVDGLYREDLLTIAKSATERDLPESADAYRRRNGGRAAVDGVLLTHCHVDHYQDLSFVDPAIPVFCTPTTRRMLSAFEDLKSADVQAEFGTVRRRFVGESKGGTFGAGRAKVETEKVTRDVREVQEGVPFDVGGFRVTPIPVDHSVPGACAFLIRTPSGKRVLYSGDVRFHGSAMDRTSALLKAVDGLEPDLMLCEGTRMGSGARDDEREVERNVTDLVRDTQGLAVAEFGWKDTTRFDTLQRVAERAGRTLVVDARLAFVLRRLADLPEVPSRRVEDYPNVRVYVRRRDSLLDEPGDYAKHEAGYFGDWGDRSAAMKAAWAANDDAYLSEGMAHYRHGLRASDVAADPSKYLLHLSFWSITELFDLQPPAGSRWIRCMTEPYSDEMALSIGKQRRWVEHFGMDHTLNDGADADGEIAPTIHVSGHGGRFDLEKLMKSAQPRVLVPVHTEEENLDHFEGLGFDARTFRGAGYRQAARGACVVDV